MRVVSIRGKCEPQLQFHPQALCVRPILPIRQIDATFTSLVDLRVLISEEAVKKPNCVSRLERHQRLQIAHAELVLSRAFGVKRLMAPSKVFLSVHFQGIGARGIAHILQRLEDYLVHSQSSFPFPQTDEFAFQGIGDQHGVDLRNRQFSEHTAFVISNFDAFWREEKEWRIISMNWPTSKGEVKFLDVHHLSFDMAPLEGQTATIISVHFGRNDQNLRTVVRVNVQGV